MYQRKNQQSYCRGDRPYTIAGHPCRISLATDGRETFWYDFHHVGLSSPYWGLPGDMPYVRIMQDVRNIATGWTIAANILAANDPHGPATATEERELRRAFHSLTWEPGDLDSHELDRILTDALADLWRDAYRQGNPQAQRLIFKERLIQVVRHATGDEGIL